METEIASIRGGMKDVAARWIELKSYWKDSNAEGFENTSMEPLRRMTARYIDEALATCRLVETTLRELEIQGF